MTLVRANPLGWAPFEELTATQINAIDSQLPLAIDGISGGEYDPDNFIEISNVNGGGLRLLEPTNWLEMETRDVTLAQGLHPLFISDRNSNRESLYDPSAGSDWVATTDAMGFKQNFVDTGGSPAVPTIWFECLRYPSGATLKSASVKIYKSGSTDPAVRPTMRLWVVAHTTGVAPSIQLAGSQTVASSYRGATRLITFTLGVPIVTTENFDQLRFIIELQGEGGSSAAVGLVALNTFLTFGITTGKP